MSDVDYWLGRAYHAHNKGTSVDDKFLHMLKIDPTMRIEAGKKLASLTDNITQKDHISRVHRETLERVLKRINTDG